MHNRNTGRCSEITSSWFGKYWNNRGREKDIQSCRAITVLEDWKSFIEYYKTGLPDNNGLEDNSSTDNRKISYVVSKRNLNSEQ